MSRSDFFYTQMLHVQNVQGRRGTEGWTADYYVKLRDQQLGSVCGLTGVKHGQN